ncbi:hypothetical protein BN14_05278 [Rhizoctonia solani AG-1 IB]|uniref:BTB domain-containing protein n=1 Tax=Thanatephorus cucumeris (strain AG1-IB / isolate 7/3/14) TaxID=1108050 RepID=M5BXB1_THACB|nr:hypothetical protein BN14_05278 [Rhizoctonia solani AG-1 IB]
MLSMPTNDETGGTAVNPIVIPPELCTDIAFTILCVYLYPSRIGCYALVERFELNFWEDVLKAAYTLKLVPTLIRILGELQAYPVIPSKAAMFLRIALSYKEAPRFLMFKGLHALAYRHQPITPEEAGILGEKGVHLITYTREKIRETLHTLLEGDSPDIEGVPELLNQLGNRRWEVFAQILNNMSPSDEKSKKDPRNIFTMCPFAKMCGHCARHEKTHQYLFQVVFNRVIHDYIMELFPIPSAPNIQTHWSETQTNEPGIQANEPDTHTNTEN